MPNPDRPNPELALLLLVILCSPVGPSAGYLMQQVNLQKPRATHADE